VISKIKTLLEPEIFDIIDKRKSEMTCTHDLKGFIGMLLNNLYGAKRYLDENSMDKYKFIETPINDFNTYFAEKKLL